MTTLAGLRIKIKKLDEEIQKVKKEFEEAMVAISESQPLGNKKENNHGNS